MKFKLLLLASAAMLCVACKEKKAEPEVEPEVEPATLSLIGTWRSVQSDDTQITTNNRTIVTYLNATKKTMSLSQYIPEFEEYTWRNKALGSYTFDGVNLTQDATDSKTSTIGTATAIDAQTMRIDNHTFVDKNGTQTPINTSVVYETVSDNLGYEQSILGLWEGVEHTGEETFGDEHHRWEYKDIDRAGYYTYVYYNYDEETKTWVAALQNISDYNVHGNWLATRWQTAGSLKTEYEWWDIDYITDTTMQWSALRMKSDSTGTFRATFTFRKVK